MNKLNKIYKKRLLNSFLQSKDQILLFVNYGDLNLTQHFKLTQEFYKLNCGFLLLRNRTAKFLVNTNQYKNFNSLFMGRNLICSTPKLQNNLINFLTDNTYNLNLELVIYKNIHYNISLIKNYLKQNITNVSVIKSFSKNKNFLYANMFKLLFEKTFEISKR